MNTIQQIDVQTHRRTEVINLTRPLADLVSGLTSGLALFYTPHTTAALLVCEDDAGLRSDLERLAEQGLANLRPFAHIKKNNPNAEAHIYSALFGTSLALPVIDGRLDLGDYQNILLLEMDGPKTRRVRCKLIPDPVP